MNGNSLFKIFGRYPLLYGSRGGKNGEAHGVRRNHARARRGVERIGKHEPCEEADARHRRRNGGHGTKAPANAHRGKRREDYQARNEQSAHYPHADDYRHCREQRGQGVVKSRPGAGRRGESLVKGHGKNTVIEYDIEHEHRRRYRGAGDNIIFAHEQNRAEHIARHIGVESRCQRCRNYADCYSRARNERYGGVALYLRVVVYPHEQECRHYNYGHGDFQRSDIQRHSHARRAEADVGEPVAYHRIALQYESHSEQGGAESHQESRYQRPAHERIGEHLNYHFNHRFSPSPQSACRRRSLNSPRSCRKTRLRARRDAKFYSRFRQRTLYRARPL